jgi:TRAP-type C4-dicarboxylate transport system permease small subunit
MPPARRHLATEEALMLASLIKFIRFIFSLIEKVLEILAMSMLTAMVIIICYQVVLRFVFNRSPSWSEEIAIVLMIWFGILSIPIGVKHHLHIGIEYLFKKFSLEVQHVFSCCIYALIGGFGVIMVVHGIQLVEFMSMSTLPATKISSAVEYVVIPISGLMLIYNASELLFRSRSQVQEAGV